MRTNDNGVNRDMTEAEVAEYETWAAIAQAEAEAQAEAQAAREVARQAVLDRLGLSAAEVQLLLGA